MADNMELISRHRCFNGEQHFYRHDSATIGLPMRFSAYRRKCFDSFRPCA